MRIVAVIQARVGSHRLPGKVLLDIEGKSMLARVVERVRRARAIDDVLVATSTKQSDAAIVGECHRMRCAVYRGEEHDVLGRFLGAAEEFGADGMVRITADCPLIDPEIIDSAVALFRGRDVDYASNVLPGRRTYPRGLDVEVVSRVALARVARSTNEPRHRSHVTLYIREEPEQFSVASLEQEKDLSHDRWTVDELPDLEFVRDVYRSLGDRNAFGWHEVKDLVAGRPDLLLVNRNVRQKALHEL